jgi:hypothetical protein
MVEEHECQLSSTRKTETGLLTDETDTHTDQDTRQVDPFLHRIVGLAITRERMESRADEYRNQETWLNKEIGEHELRE